MKKKPKVKERAREPFDSRRSRILNEAEKLIIRKGYSATSMRDVAVAARVSLGNLYNHFKSKEEIFDALIALRSPAAEIERLVGFIEREEFPENIFEIAKAIKGIVDRNMVFVRLADIDGIEFGGVKTLGIIVASIAKAAPPLLQKYEKRRGMGAIRELDPQVAMPFIALSLLAIFVLRNRFGPFWLEKDGGPAQDDYVISQMTDILLYGLLPRKI